MKAIVVNYFGGPGCGKTTAASETFVGLKKFGISTELVSEFAKELIVQGNTEALQHQWYVTGNQAYKVWCAAQRADVVLVDSPVLLGPIYDIYQSEALKNVCLEEHNRYKSINVYVERKNYAHNMFGRVHSLTQSVSYDKIIKEFLINEHITHITLSNETQIAKLVYEIKDLVDLKEPYDREDEPDPV